MRWLSRADVERALQACGARFVCMKHGSSLEVWCTSWGYYFLLMQEDDLGYESGIVEDVLGDLQSEAAQNGWSKTGRHATGPDDKARAAGLFGFAVHRDALTFDTCWTHPDGTVGFSHYPSEGAAWEGAYELGVLAYV